LLERCSAPLPAIGSVSGGCRFAGAGGRVEAVWRQRPELNARCTAATRLRVFKRNWSMLFETFVRFAQHVLRPRGLRSKKRLR
jgi:hypothetical protein